MRTRGNVSRKLGWCWVAVHFFVTLKRNFIFNLKVIMFLIGRLSFLLISLPDVKMCDILYLNSHLILVSLSWITEIRIFLRCYLTSIQCLVYPNPCQRSATDYTCYLFLLLDIPENTWIKAAPTFDLKVVFGGKRFSSKTRGCGHISLLFY